MARTRPGFFPQAMVVDEPERESPLQRVRRLSQERPVTASTAIFFVPYHPVGASSHHHEVRRPVPRFGGGESKD